MAAYGGLVRFVDAERTARLEAAILECNLQAGDEKEATIRSLVDQHMSEAKHRRRRVNRRAKREDGAYRFRVQRRVRSAAL